MPEGSRVLDIGCGTGLFLALAAATRRGIHGRGIDVSPKAIAVARTMARTARSDGLEAALEFAVGDVTGGVGGGLFDVVSLIDVAHHLPREGAVELLRAAARCVRPGGVLIYKDLPPQPLAKAFANRIHDLILARQWVSYLPLPVVEETVHTCGFTLAYAATLPRYWYHHELRIFRKEPVREWEA